MNILSHESVLEDGTLTGGEPDEFALAELKEAGFKTLISLRGIGESPFEGAYFESLGFEFIHLPISGPADFTPDFIAAFDRALTEAEGKTVVFCATGNRVGAAFALHGHHMKGLSKEEALAFGMSAGLTRLAGFVQQHLNAL